MEQYKQEFIEFMIDSQVLKFGDFCFEERTEIPLFYERRGLCDRYPASAGLGTYYAKAIHDHYGLDFDVALRARL